MGALPGTVHTEPCAGPGSGRAGKKRTRGTRSWSHAWCRAHGAVNGEKQGGVKNTTAPVISFPPTRPSYHGRHFF